ncbi:MAG TPA: toxin-antitoxin system YwqK family antitoxin [Bacteroidia bacterium]|nr:toxin-antitoxin system YwqK family antitoxin [Bacteroidia bacterium]
MMKKFTFLILFVITGTSFCYSAGEDTLNQLSPDGKRQGWWIIRGRMKPEKKGFDPEAKIEEGRYKDSQKMGVWIEYFPNGNKKSQLTYVNNRPNGHAVIFNENGTRAEEGTWVGSRWMGDYHLYYEDGMERQAFNYNDLGQREGKQTYKHPNGKIAIEVDMKSGKESGWKKEYDENGNLIRETYFADGTMDPSKTKTYTPSTPAPVAKAPEEKELKGNAPTVTGTDFKPNTGTFNGEGPWILYKNGQISMKGTFRSKKLIDGEERIYDNNGLLIRIKLYKEGKYVGDGPLPADANK